MKTTVTRKKHINMVQHTTEVSGLTIDEAAAAVEGQAVQLVPVDQGYLQDSIYREKTGDMEAEVGATQEYASVVEFGSGSQRPQPYLRPALDAVRSKLDRIWGEQFRRNTRM